MSHQQAPRAGPRARQIDNQVPRLGRQRDLAVSIVEVDPLARHPSLREDRNHILANRPLPAGDPLDREEAEQPLDGSLLVNPNPRVDHKSISSTRRREKRIHRRDAEHAEKKEKKLESRDAMSVIVSAFSASLR